MLMIGSNALAEHIYKLSNTDATWDMFRTWHTEQDVDYICTIEEYDQWCRENRGDIREAYPLDGGNTMTVRNRYGERYEFSIAWPGTTNETILKMEAPDHSKIASLNMLLLLKLSHRYKKNSPHFMKTMNSIMLLRALGANVSGMEDLLKAREKETYTYAHPKLNQSKSSFFREEDSFYRYDHDSIHRAVAVGERPAYTAFATDGEEVHSSKRLWDKLNLHQQLLAGLEESYVLAIERSLVPHPGVLTNKQAFDMALMKVCTSITSGWFREFCWENYNSIQRMYDDSYFDKFTAALEAGNIQEYKRAA